MKKLVTPLASASFVVALALSLVAPVGAQTTYTTDTTGTTNTTLNNTTSTSGTDMTSASSSASGTTSGSTTPGLPNTGAGGDTAMNVAILLSSAIVAVGGTVLVARKLAA